MFEIIHLFVIALAALPLARTLMLGAGGEHIAFVHRLYRDAAYILAAVLGIIVFEVALRISLENYWFQELGQSRRYWLSLEYRVAIFFVVSLLIGVFIGANLRLLSRPYVVPTSAPWVVGFVVAALAGFLATPLCIPLVRLLGATPWRDRQGIGPRATSGSISSRSNAQKKATLGNAWKKRDRKPVSPEEAYGRKVASVLRLQLRSHE
jgi:hypothetical protein